MFLKALIESFQNQVSLLDLEQVVRNAVDLQSSTDRVTGGSTAYTVRPTAVRYASRLTCDVQRPGGGGRCTRVSFRLSIVRDTDGLHTARLHSSCSSLHGA